MLGELSAQADRAMDLVKDFQSTAREANEATSGALKVASDAVALLKTDRETAALLANYFAMMAVANEREVRPGDTSRCSGSEAFRHAAELLTKLACGEHIVGLR